MHFWNAGTTGLPFIDPEIANAMTPPVLPPERIEAVTSRSADAEHEG